MRLVILLMLLPLHLMGVDSNLDPRWLNGETSSIPTSDPRIRQIRFFKWGALGKGGVTGDFVPQGQVWLIKAAGIFTNDGEYREWMMQIQVQEPFGPGVPYFGGTFDFMLVPCHRLTGFALGTPTLAMDREVILMPGEALCGRVNGILPDKQIGLLYVGWAFHENMLPFLLGVSGGQ